jgi:cysteine-rich repeat protein
VSKKFPGSPGSVAIPVSRLLGILLGSLSCDDTMTTLCDSGRRCPVGWTCAAEQDICIQGGCGDGIIDRTEGETCDDGDIENTGSCSADCRKLLSCGNGISESGEICDDGNEVSGDGCSKDCLSLGRWV